MPSNVKLNNLPINVDSEASDIRAALKEQEDIKDAMRDYNRIRVSNVRDLNIFINKHMFDDVFSSFNLKPSGILNSFPNIPIANAEFEDYNCPKIIPAGIRIVIMNDDKTYLMFGDAPAKLKTSRLHTAGFRIHLNPVL